MVHACHVCRKYIAVRRWRVTGYVAGHVSFWERVESSLWIRQSSISVISSQFHATRQNEQKHGKAFSEQELKNIARLILLPRSYFFCRDSCGPPYILFSKKQTIKTVSFIRMKKDYYSYNDRLFPSWTVAHSFKNANFATPTPCSILSFIAGRL